MIVDRDTEVTTTSSSSVWKKPYLSRKWMAGWDSDEKEGLLVLPFSDNPRSVRLPTWLEGLHDPG